MNSIERIINKLKVYSTQNQLIGKPTEPEDGLDSSEINQLLGHTSVLSLSDTPNDKILAYEIITRLLEITTLENNKILSFAEVIISRLGNFPARQLLRERFEFKNNKIKSFLKLECLSREIENSIFIDDEPIQLTDFQYDFFNSLQVENALSISAPTSAGKSFVLGLDLIRKLRTSENQCVIYIVPTRALITEVSNRVRDSLRKYELENIVVRTAPFPISKENLKGGAVYVLTQERLMSYLSNNEDEMPVITSLIVDEAHEIQNGKRGILLQSAIDYLLKKYPNTKILFASPLISNPGYFFNVFNISYQGKFFTETISPVSQNVILVSDVSGKPQEICFELLTEKKKLSLGNRAVNFKFRGNVSAQRANFAYSVSNKLDSVIVFANGASDAESVAMEISKLITEYEPSPEIDLFIDFLIKEIHPDYPLINCLKSGVGFHYGNMPSIVRSGVEDLFKSDQIKFICCTSTLLQGVNLPAKHIIIEKPKSGDNPMSRSDFLNLSGRAGRLLKEFHGNIWCIRPSTWADNCYEGDKLQEITTAIHNVMSDGGVIIQNLLSGETSSSILTDKAEMAFSKLYHDFHYSGSNSTIEKYRTNENSESLDKTILKISKIIIDIPFDILERNKSVRPDQLQYVYDFLISKECLEEYLPISPYTAGSKAIMDNIINVFVDCFKWDLPDKYKSFISYIAYNWMWGKPLNELLKGQIKHIKETDQNKKPSNIIRDYLKVLDNDIRFKMVKYFSAYNDILKLALTNKGVAPDEIEIEPYHIYLEFGSCKKDALNIMATGLSRFTALHLIRFNNIIPAVSDIDDYFQHIKNIDVRGLTIPNLCKKEILNMQGKNT